MPETRVRRSWVHHGTRVLRNVAIAVALMTAVPVALVGVGGSRMWRTMQLGGSAHTRTIIAERSRPFVLPSDVSITPARAGLAYAALQLKAGKPSAIPLVEPPSRPERSWKELKISDAMFRTAKPNVSTVPATPYILRAAARGFSSEEMAYLRTLATAPVWREYDILARAPAVDLVGGLVRMPLPAGATWEQFPIARFAGTKELAYASVSRAAYHLSIGQRDSAEAALRSAISVGFALIDNGSNLMDQLIGDVMIGIGRDALREFYVVTGDPRAASPALAEPAKDALTASPADARRRMSTDDLRRLAIARATDPATPRGERFETMRMLTMSSCSSVGSMLMGPPKDVQDAIAGAARILGRYPSERELVRLARQPLLVRHADIASEPMAQVVASIATVPGVVLNRPQLATCALIAGSELTRPSR